MIHLPLFLGSLRELSSKQISNADLQPPTDKRVLKKVLARHRCAEFFTLVLSNQVKPFIFSNFFVLLSALRGASFQSHFSKGDFLQLPQQLLCVPESFSAVLSVQRNKSSSRGGGGWSGVFCYVLGTAVQISLS